MPTQSFVRIQNGWPSIDIGALRHLITILKFASTSPPTYDVAGPILEWIPVVTCNAAINPISGKDVIRGGQTTTQLNLAIAIWYQDGILPNMRVQSDNGSIYVIQSIENVLEMNVVLTLNCVGLALND
jgi:SPP1 family predicted phage head-tail adaptor